MNYSQHIERSSLKCTSSQVVQPQGHDATEQRMVVYGGFFILFGLKSCLEQKSTAKKNKQVLAYK